MNEDKKRFTGVVRCEHCNNSAPMEVVAEYSKVKAHFHEEANLPIDEGDIYELINCPACDEVTLRKYYYAEYQDPGEGVFVTLYPYAEKQPTALPPTVMTAYQAAAKVRSIDPNAYAVLIGRVLELVCNDRKAEGATLYEKLEDLGNKREIPRRLVDMAHSLRQLRNVGAHASLGELTKEEIPFLDDLCRAVVEYVYSAPELVEKARRRLDEIRSGGNTAPGKIQ